MTRARPRVLLDVTPLRGESVLHGIGRYTYDLLRGLAETHDEWRSDLAIEAVVDLRWVRSAPVTVDFAALAEDARTAERALDWGLIARRFFTLGRAVLERRADLVHLLQARGVPFLLPARSVVTCYDLIPLRFPREYLGSEANRVWRFVRDWHRYRMPTRVACISARTATDLTLLGVDPSRIDVVTTGIDLSQWSSPPSGDDAERRLRLGVGEKRYVLYVGYCDYRKNVRGMFDALALARRGADVELVWAGDLPPPSFVALKEQAEEHGVGGAVRFLGFVADPDLAALYRGAVALLFVSRLEGFGLPVAEAMAAGCPTIVASGSGCEEVAGGAGIVVSPDDAQATADAIARLLGSEEERAALAARGRVRAPVFDRKEMARGYVNSYLTALGSAGS